MKKSLIIIGILLLLGISILMPSIMLTLIVDFIFEVPGSFIVLMICLVIIIIMFLLGWGISFAINKVTDGKVTWPKTITLCTISILSAWLIAMVLGKVGYLMMFNLALPKIIGSLIMVAGLILAFVATGLAIKQVINVSNRNWAISIILIFITIYVMQGAIHFFRNDYFNAETGESKVAATFSFDIKKDKDGKEEKDKNGDIIPINIKIKKIFYNLPRKVKYDPETGDLIRRNVPKSYLIEYLANKNKFSGNETGAGQKKGWEKVFFREYIGQGMNKGDIIPGLPVLFKDILKQDKIIIKGTKFKFLNGPWQEYSGGMETICGNPDEPGPIEVLAPKGEKIFVEVQRFM
jgi:hypothetical protein